MPAAGLPDYATRVCHNVTVTTSLPLLALFSPTRELYRVEAARKSEPSVERRSLERKGGILRNVLDCVTKAVGYPIVSLVFGALSVAIYSASVSVVAKVAATKDEMPAIKDAAPPREDSPPPSRPPSPPPVDRNPSVDSESDSAWSILIEELQDEPKSAADRERGRTSQRSRRSRSASWSRNLMNSFRRKKSKASRSEERHRPNADADESTEQAKDAEPEAPVVEQTSAPKKSSSQVELSQHVKPKPSRVLSLGSFRRRKSGAQLVDSSTVEKSADQVDASVPAAAPAVDDDASEVPTVSAQQEPQANIEAEVAKDDGAHPVKEKPTRMLSFGSFRRRKPADSPKPEPVNKEEEVAEATDNPVSETVEVNKEVEAKPKSRMLSFSSFGRRKPLPDRSSSLDQAVSEDAKPKAKPKKDKANKSETKDEPKNEEAPDDSSKSKAKKQPKSKPEDGTVKSSKSKTSRKTQDAKVVEAPESIPENEAVVKRNAFVNFFKREKKSATVDLAAEEPTTEPAPLKKGSRLRNSFARRMKTKSVDVDAQSASTTSSSTTRVPRSSSLFGSSFSLKRVFHSSDPEPHSQHPTRSQSGILTKRGGGSSSGSRPKSVQLDESPQFMDKEPENELKQTFGFKFKPKKPSRAKSLEQSKPAEVTERRSSSEDEATEAGQAPLEAAGTLADATTENKELAAVTDAIPSDPVPEPNTKQMPAANPKNNARTPAGQSTRIDRDRAAIDQSIDEAFLKEFVKNNPDAEKVANVRLTSIKPALDRSLKETVAEVLIQLTSSPSTEGNQLKEILDNPLFQVLADTHDSVATEFQDRVSNELSPPDTLQPVEYFIEWDMPADANAVRIVGLRRNPGEPLGLTVKTEDGQLVIARILGGGSVDRQGLLHVGDIIGEVNNVPVYTAEQLQVEIARSKEHVQLKILPSAHESIAHGAQVGIAPSTILASETINNASACCVRAHFDYEPKEDKLLPCPEIGLAFKKGDILQVVNQSDPNWWQAKKVGWSGPAGLIPSQELEERRKAFVAPEADFVHKIGFCGARISKKKKKLMYQIKSSVDLDKAELLLYEEVTRMPPFRRKTLVLVGSEGIGRRTLKNRLINSDPERFGTTLPHTSRPMRELEEDGMGYWFVSREEMEHDIRDHQFLEYGEHNGHLYGTKLDTIRTVIRQGKMCVLDCSPNSLKILHNSPEFMPYVIFLAAPGMEQLKSLYEAASSRYSSRNLGGTFERSSSIRFSSRRARTLESLVSLYEEEDFKNALEESARIQRTYEKYFDMVIVNEDPDHTFRKVIESLENLSNQHQWVPVSWVY